MASNRRAMAEDVVIVGGARTPFCEWQGVQAIVSGAQMIMSNEISQ